jgi:GGDEF domain-containing protein
MVRMRDEMASVERRLAESEITDPVTGLMNRREMERRIEASKNSPAPVTKVLLSLSGDVTDDIAKQAAERISTQFRHQEIVGRWGHAEFMVLFQGPVDIAEMRVAQVIPWISGRYALDNGGVSEIGVEMRLVDVEAAVR